MEREEAQVPAERIDAKSGLSHDAIRRQLDRILGHREFQATDRMRDFLRFVVEETLEGRKHRIKGYTIATRVFGREEDFDAGQDPIVSIQAGRLRRALERYYLVSGGRDPIRIDIPKGRYVPRFTAQTVDRRENPRGVSSHSAEYATAAIGPSIAVLPLENLTDDADQDFFAVGLAEDLITELTRFRDIAVISCQRPPTDDPQPANLAELGRAAGARFVLRGTVRRDPKTVKVAVQLTDTQSGRQVWADSYTHPVDASHLIATQEQIARSVVAAVASEYGIVARRLSAESRKKPPAELSTYEAMLRYYSHQIAPSPESGATCLAALQQAVDGEPEYGPAWSALATLHCQMYSADLPGVDNPLETALRYARRGVLLEPGSQLGRLIMAYASYLADDEVSFNEEIATAINLNPNSPYAVGTAGHFFCMRGSFERGLPLLEQAIAANPCHPRWFHGGYVIDFVRRREYERALLEVQNHSPFQSFWLPVAHTAILGRLGRTDEAQEHVAQVQDFKPDFASRARELLRRALKIETVIDDLIDGLRAAGLSVETH